jgi:hypothetical protein
MGGGGGGGGGGEGGGGGGAEEKVICAPHTHTDSKHSPAISTSINTPQITPSFSRHSRFSCSDSTCYVTFTANHHRRTNVTLVTQERAPEKQKLRRRDLRTTQRLQQLETGIHVSAKWWYLGEGAGFVAVGGGGGGVWEDVMDYEGCRRNVSKSKQRIAFFLI